MSEVLLKTAVWNIEGLTVDKVIDQQFIKHVSKFHIIGFVETWANDSDNVINIPSFHLVDTNNRRKHKKARRNSGGINVLVQNSICKGISKLPKFHPDILWIKLDHIFFKLERDIYIATVYISPENSSAKYVDGLEPIYAQLLADVVKVSNLGNIIVHGDFNAYTNIKPDFITFDNDIQTNIDDDQYISDQSRPRNNLDHKLMNNSGKHLLNMCKESGLTM